MDIKQLICKELFKHGVEDRDQCFKSISLILEQFIKEKKPSYPHPSHEKLHVALDQYESNLIEGLKEGKWV